MPNVQLSSCKAEEKAKEKQMEKSLKLLELILRPLLVYQTYYRL